MSSYYKILKEAEDYYFSIGSIKCTLLDNAPIYFTRKGFRHFIRKKSKFRPISDQVRRFKLLPYIIQVLTSKNTIIKYSKGKSYDFWSLEKEFDNNQIIKILISKKEEGKYSFFSIMSNKK